jgi:molybdopterin biosynthesis enzyme
MTAKRQTYRNLKPLKEAQDIFFSRFRNLLMGTETIPVRRALGRLLAGSVKAE